MVPLGFRGREERGEKDETREEREEGDEDGEEEEEEGEKEEEEEERGDEEETIKIEKNPPRSVSREARYSYYTPLNDFSNIILLV